MTMRRAIEEARSLLDQVVHHYGLKDVAYDVAEPKEEQHGDLYSNLAFQMSKIMRRSPGIVAEEVCGACSRFMAGCRLIAGVEPHRAGYINFRLNIHELTRMTLDEVRRRGSLYGSVDIGRGRRVLVEHTSVNPNKALHIGHVRNLVLGDTIYRILRFTNHDVLVLNYIDDSGLQVADIVVGFRYLGFPLESSKKFDHYCGDDVYVRVNEMYEHDPSLMERRREVLKAMEDYDSDTARFAREVTRRVLDEQLKTCWRLNARYDCLNFESQIIASRLWDRALGLMEARDIVKVEDDPGSKYHGCLVVKAGIEGEEKVLVRSDGTSTYIAKDIPYAMWKIGLLDDPFKYVKYVEQPDGSVLWATSLHEGSKLHMRAADEAITVIDVRQSRLQRIISKILSMLDGRGRYTHLAYEVVALSSSTARLFNIEIGDRRFAHMKGREGIYINADDMLDMLHNKAYEEVKARNPEADERWLHATAEHIAVAAMRYSMLKQDLDKIITFDVEDALNLQGESGQYIQYAYARASRILERAAGAVGDGAVEIDPSCADLICMREEVALVKAMARFDLVVEDTVRSLNPKTMARYCYNLAMVFNEFYEKVPVLHEQDHNMIRARLSLVKAFTITLGNCMSLLGIHTLDRM
ncbi:MAG: arginine--tRNA ligase [Candidatus Nitrosocaldus sp.]|nr:arginine--tRNA ligase [Candidatus Nitrosocaldus sp.]